MEGSQRPGFAGSDQLDTLVIQTLAFCPSLETAGEICLDHAARGNRTGFAFIFTDDPECHPPFGIWPFHATVQRKVRALQELLAQHGVEIVAAAEPDGDQAAAIRKFSHASVDSLDALMSLEYRGAKLGQSVASTIVSETRDSTPTVQDYPLSKRLHSAAYIFEVARQIIKERKPGLVVLYNGRFATCRPILEAAGAEGVPFNIFDSGSGRDKYAVFDQMQHDLAYIRAQIQQAWSTAPASRHELGSSFFTRRRGGDGINFYSFTTAQSKGLSLPRSRDVRITYFTSSDDEWVAIRDGVRQHLFPSQRDAIRFLVDWVQHRTDTELIVRVHPNLASVSKRERNWWHRISGPNVTVVPASSSIDSYALAESSDKVVSYGSTMGIESTYWRRPSILMGDAIYAALDAVYEPPDIPALRHLLEADFLAPKPMDNCLPYGYYSVTYGTPYRFYKPLSLADGTLLGRHLSMDLAAVRFLKRSDMGLAIRRLRDRFARELGSF